MEASIMSPSSVFPASISNSLSRTVQAKSGVVNFAPIFSSGGDRRRLARNRRLIARVSVFPASISNSLSRTVSAKSGVVNFAPIFSSGGDRRLARNRRLIARVSVLDAVSAVNASDPAQADVTWQIVIGAIAGITPFVVAGIEFSKRIMAQRRCGVCGGSGLVLRDNKYYFRCPNCGGFLPWQSWKRFFTG